MDQLLADQAHLQAQANALVARLDLVAQLSAIGRPVRVGSSAMGLMVRRDIDITVICAKLDAALLARFATVGAGLMARTDLVSHVRFRNDSGRWNAEPDAYPDGLYLGLTARDEAGDSWSFDIWAIDDPSRQPDLRHLETLLPRLTDNSRATIIAIKKALLTETTTPGPSARVYEAVMDHGVADLAGFKDWLRDSGKTA